MLNMNSQGQPRKSLWRNISVEPVMFLNMSAFWLTSVVEESLFIDKACRINLGLPANVCDHINSENSTIYKKKVQVIVANYRQYESIALHAFPIVVFLLLGAWSDKHGRKLPMLLGLFGLLYYALMMIVNIKQDWPLEIVIYTVTFPSAITGSSLTILLAGFTYIADITTVKERTFRVTLLEVACVLPMPINIALGSYLFTNVVNRSYSMIFCIYAVLEIAAIICACLTMEWNSNRSCDGCETKSNDIAKSSWLLDIWNRDVFIDTFKTLFRKRPDNRRMYLLLVIVAMAVYTFERDEKHVLYLYTQLQFHWSVEAFSRYRTFQCTLLVLGLLFGVPMITKGLSLGDTVVVMVSCLSFALAKAVFATAQQASVFYIGAAVSSFGTIGTPGLRSIVSKLVPQSERGKAFSILTVANTSVPIVSSAIYNYVYSATINTAPAAFLWVSVTTQLLVFFLTLIIHVSLDGKILEQAEDSKELTS